MCNIHCCGIRIAARVGSVRNIIGPRCVLGHISVSIAYALDHLPLPLVPEWHGVRSTTARHYRNLWVFLYHRVRQDQVTLSLHPAPLGHIEYACHYPPTRSYSDSSTNQVRRFL